MSFLMTQGGERIVLQQGGFIKLRFAGIYPGGGRIKRNRWNLCTRNRNASSRYQ